MANTVTRYTPRDAVSTRSLIDQLVEGSFFAPSLFERWTNQMPSVPANLVETSEAYIVEIGLPGIEADKLEIQSLGRELRVKGVYKTAKHEKGEYVWSGLPAGEFTQAFTLPASVANDAAEASYVNGILTITLPKAENAKVKTIPVKTTV